jgi:thiamine pyrophosphate-dependent acetolactate synthase large subunit-like protein
VPCCADAHAGCAAAAAAVVQVPRKLIGTDGFQETPIVEVTRAITKHNYLVMDIADLPRVIKEVRGGLCFLGGGTGGGQAWSMGCGWSCGG